MSFNDAPPSTIDLVLERYPGVKWVEDEGWHWRLEGGSSARRWRLYALSPKADWVYRGPRGRAEENCYTVIDGRTFNRVLKKAKKQVASFQQEEVNRNRRCP